jgi:hypothetical protein
MRWSITTTTAAVAKIELQETSQTATLPNSHAVQNPQAFESTAHLPTAAITDHQLRMQNEDNLTDPSSIEVDAIKTMSEGTSSDDLYSPHDTSSTVQHDSPVSTTQKLVSSSRSQEKLHVLNDQTQFEIRHRMTWPHNQDGTYLPTAAPSSPSSSK